MLVDVGVKCVVLVLTSERGELVPFVRDQKAVADGFQQRAVWRFEGRCPMPMNDWCPFDIESFECMMLNGWWLVEWFKMGH